MLPSKDQWLSDSEEVWLLSLMENVHEDYVDDSVFLQTWIPSSLAEIGDVQDVERLIAEKSKGLNTVYDSLIMTSDEDDDSDISVGDDDYDQLYTEEGSDIAGPIADGTDGHRPTNMTKQEWKTIVKEEKREARKNKVPKHLKHKRNMKKYGCK
jgi:RIO kinase 1